jgi:hypothetical protein
MIVLSHPSGIFSAALQKTSQKRKSGLTLGSTPTAPLASPSELAR